MPNPDERAPMSAQMQDLINRLDLPMLPAEMIPMPVKKDPGSYCDKHGHYLHPAGVVCPNCDREERDALRARGMNAMCEPRWIVCFGTCRCRFYTEYHADQFACALRLNRTPYTMEKLP